MTVLHTKTLTLRPCSPADRGDFIALEHDPQVMRYLNGGRAVDPLQDPAEATFLMPRGTEASVWTGRRAATGAFVGWFCLWSDGARVAELGYRLRRADWGQGLASEGAQALISWGFDGGLYDRVFAGTAAENLASRRVMEKIGMIFVRDLEGGEVEYAVKRDRRGLL